MVEYRSFRNGDPPQLVKLWHQCQLGRGAAKGFTPDGFEFVNFSQPYFDRDGLILAIDGDRCVGMVHAGFGPDETKSRLSYDQGIICAVMVHPQYRRQGIGRELLQRAEAYLTEKGAQQIQAGQSRGLDPFYFGLYGGARPSGFLVTDYAADPFLKNTGYQPSERIGVYQRDIQQTSDPVHFKLISIRRSTELTITDQPLQPTWWWFARFGRVDSLRFNLTPKRGGVPIASVTVVGLDAYVATWNARCIGLVDIDVREEERGKGYARALLVEVARHMRQELVTLAEIHCPESNEYATRAITGAGFARVDTGIVYRKL